MIKKENFVSRKNYHVAFVADKVIWIIYYFCKIFKIIKFNTCVHNRVIFFDYGHLGDALLLTPAIRVLKEERKDSEIYCLVSKSGFKALVNNPNIKRIITIELPWYSENPNILKAMKEFFNLIKLIRSIKAEVMINFRDRKSVV